MTKEKLIENNQFAYAIDKAWSWFKIGTSFYSDTEPKVKLSGTLWADLKTKEVKVYQDNKKGWLVIASF